MSAGGFDIAALFSEIWAAAKQAGPFGCMLALWLLFRSDNKLDAARKELAELHATRAEELKKSADIAEDNVKSNAAVLTVISEALEMKPRRRPRR